MIRLLPTTKATFGLQLPDRISMLKNMVSNLILHEQIVTTRARALAIRPIAELVIKNAITGKQDLKAEAEQWITNHSKTLPLLYGPLVTRYQNHKNAYTRVYNLLHKEYYHVPMAVIELVNGPKDTLINLEKYKEELATFKEQNSDLFSMDIDKMMQTIKTSPNGRFHAHHKKLKDHEKKITDTLLEAGKEKSMHVMKCFALNAIGKLPIEEQPRFWVR